MYIKANNAFARRATWSIQALDDLRADIEEVALERQQNGMHYAPKLARLLARLESKLEIIQATTASFHEVAIADFNRRC